MTRFDAATPADRRSLFADAVAAHRTRGSAFLTVEAVRPPDGADPGVGGDADGTDEAEIEGEEAEAEVPPWVQFGDGTFNLDCTDGELDRLEATLESFPEFRIDALDSPEDADGTNVRVSARSDADRLAEFVERAFREVYGRPENYRAWVTQV